MHESQVFSNPIPFVVFLHVYSVAVTGTISNLDNLEEADWCMVKRLAQGLAIILPGDSG